MSIVALLAITSIYFMPFSFVGIGHASSVTPPHVSPPQVTPPHVTPPEVVPREVVPPEVTPPEITPREVTPPDVTPPDGASYDYGFPGVGGPGVGGPGSDSPIGGGPGGYIPGGGDWGDGSGSIHEENMIGLGRKIPENGSTNNFLIDASKFTLSNIVLNSVNDLSRNWVGDWKNFDWQGAGIRDLRSLGKGAFKTVLGNIAPDNAFGDYLKFGLDAWTGYDNYKTVRNFFKSGAGLAVAGGALWLGSKIYAHRKTIGNGVKKIAKGAANIGKKAWSAVKGFFLAFSFAVQYTSLPFNILSIPLWPNLIHLFFMLICYTFIQIPYISMAIQWDEDDEITLRRAYGDTLKHMFPVYIYSLVYAISVMAGMFLLLIPGLVFYRHLYYYTVYIPSGDQCSFERMAMFLHWKKSSPLV